MEKKCIALLCALVLTLSCVGCAGGAANETTPPVETTEHVHDYAKEVVEPTCTKGGYTGYYCACGDSYKEAETDPLGHRYTDKVVEPTWDEEGYTIHICDACGEAYRDSYVECQKFTTLPASQSGEVMHFFDDAAFIGDSVSLKLQHRQRNA